MTHPQAPLVARTTLVQEILSRSSIMLDMYLDFEMERKIYHEVFLSMVDWLKQNGLQATANTWDNAMQTYANYIRQYLQKHPHRNGVLIVKSHLAELSKFLTDASIPLIMQTELLAPFQNAVPGLPRETSLPEERSVKDFKKSLLALEPLCEKFGIKDFKDLKEWALTE